MRYVIGNLPYQFAHIFGSAAEGCHDFDEHRRRSHRGHRRRGPEVDTVLFLRPTESATVFLHQLGRGLLLTRGKPVLTALDFVGHQRREFRFDQRFRAMTGLGGKALQRQVEEGFPFLPSGSQIILDSVAQGLVLENIRQQVAQRWAALVSEVRAHPDNRLASNLDASGRGLEDVLKNNRSWTSLCRDAGKLDSVIGPR
jgi:hypothetical protein